MITKEQFNSVWKNTSKEGILNQFYYEHIDLMKYISVLDEIREYIDGVITIWETNPSTIATLDLEYLLQQIDKVKE